MCSIIENYEIIDVERSIVFFFKKAIHVSINWGVLA